MAFSPEELQARVDAINRGDFFAPSGGTPEKGVGGHVLDFLGYFDRPRNAVATAVQEGLSSDPNASAAGGFYRGFTGQKQTSWGDVVGLDPGTSEMGWPEWLAREGGRLGMDVVGDPLNLLFAPAKAGKLLGGAVKAIGVPEGRSIAGLAAGAARLPEAADWIERKSGLGKMFRAGTGDEASQALYNAATREGATTEQFVRENQATIAKALEEAGIGSERLPELFAAIERKGAGLPEDMAPGILDAFQPLVEKHNELFAARNTARAARGLKPLEDISGEGYQHISHIRTDIPLDAGPKSRTLTRWTTEEGIEPVPGFVSSGKAEDMAARGFFKDPQSGEWYHHSDPTSFVGPERQVDIGQIYKEGAMPKGSFIEDPAAALGIGIKRSQEELTQLKFLDAAEKQGLLINLNRPGMLAKEAPTLEQSMQLTGQTGGAPQKLPEGYRQLLVPGMEEYAAPWKLANFIENQARTSIDKSTPMGAIHEALAPLFKGRAGKVYDEASGTWKRNVLAHPGWLAGNIATNPAMAYTHGDVAPQRLIPRMVGAGKVLLGRGDDVIPGLENATLKNEMALRGIDVERGTGQYGAGETGRATQGPGFLRRNLPESLQPIATGAEWYGKNINERVFAAGNWAEQNNKVAVAIDWLKQNAPDFAAKSPDEQAKLLDQAAQKGHDALINYDARTPFRREVLQKFIPFEPWITGMTANTVDTALTKPQRLANLGRAYDTIFEPMDQGDKAISDQWMQENAQTRGMLGTSYDDIVDKVYSILGMEPPGPNPAGKRTFMAGRFIPQQQLQAASERPLDTIMSMLNPIPKTVYEVLANKNTFKEKTIDPIAGSGIAGIINPLIGGDYAKAGEKTFGVELPASWQHLLSQSPAGRTTNELSTGARGIGLTSDPYKAEMSPAEAAMWWLTGGRLYPFDAQKQMQHRTYEYKKQLQEVRSRKGYAIKKGNTEGFDYYQAVEDRIRQEKNPSFLGIAGAEYH